MSGIPVAGSIEMITDKKRDRKINKLIKQRGKSQKELARLQKKVKNKKLELAGLNYDLDQLTKEGS